MLRKHQREMLNLAKMAECGTTFTTTIAVVTPGGGKSKLPFILGDQLERRGIIRKILWVVPQRSLVLQAEKDPLSPLTMKITGRSFMLEAMQGNASLLYGWPADGFGIVTTHQAVEAAPLLYENLLGKADTLVVVDEAHHIVEGSRTGIAFEPIYERAKYLLLMTGTLQRNVASEKVLGVDYVENANGTLSPDLDTGVMDIRYTRTDALSEKAIIPIYHERVDGCVEWVAATEAGRTDNSVDTLIGQKDKTGQALEAALSGKYAMQLLDRAVQAWSLHKSEPNKQNAKLLVVAPNKKEARRYLKHLKVNGVSAELAISADRGDVGIMDGDALAAIEKFKLAEAKGGCGVLVSVGMAYEGLDVPSITHIACLTRYRSFPWLEQMLARATRFDPNMGPWESQAAYVFAPADDAFTKVLAQIRAEQDAVVKVQSEGPEGPGGDGPPPRPEIIAGDSDVTVFFSEDGQTGDVIKGDEWKRLNAIREKAGLSISLEQMKNLFALKESVEADMNAGLDPTKEDGLVASQTTLTSSRQRKEWLAKLNRAADRVVSRHCVRESDRSGMYAVVNNVINDHLGVRNRKDNPTISLDALAMAAAYFSSTQGVRDLEIAAQNSLTRKVR